jgi:glutamine synthetase
MFFVILHKRDQIAVVLAGRTGHGMVHLSDSAQQLIEQVNEQRIAYLELQFTDVTGMSKSVQAPARQLAQALRDGVWFDGSAIEGFARVAELDMYLRPDASTFAVYPWGADGRRVGRVICDVYTPNGEPYAGDPRFVLRRAAEAAAALGYRYVVSPELEYFLLRYPLDLSALQFVDQVSYFDTSSPELQTFQQETADALEMMGIEVASHHHEVGCGQHELDLAPLDVLAMADAIMTARFVVKAVARRHSLHATFMPKPLAGAAGSGMHIHQTLLGLQDGQNAFAEASDDYGLSAVGRSFLAGQLAHARAMCAVLAPLVNSYKRLVAGLEAPVFITWAQLNRAALIRVPRTRSKSPSAVGLELRCVDPSCNPYLALAVMLRAGLDGVTRGLEVPNPAEEELYLFKARRQQMAMLPTSLNEALEAMQDDPLIADALGLNAYERFLDAKRIEWNEYVLEVSPWEIQRYLTTY